MKTTRKAVRLETKVDLTGQGWREVARHRQVEVERLQSWLRLIGRLTCETGTEDLCRRAIAGDEISDPRFSL